MSLFQELDSEIKKLDLERERLLKINGLLISYPDLESSCDRWNHERLFSKSVNPIVDRVDFNHSCGCCSDAPLYAYPYIEVDGIKIHSDPLYIPIGEKGYGYCGDMPYDNWEENFQKRNISEEVIHLVKKHFEDNPWSYHKEEEDEEL